MCSSHLVDDRRVLIADVAGDEDLERLTGTCRPRGRRLVRAGELRAEPREVKVAETRQRQPGQEFFGEARLPAGRSRSARLVELDAANGAVLIETGPGRARSQC